MTDTISPLSTETADLFLRNFHHVATIGATDRNGVERQAATEEDRQTRDWFSEFARSRGWTVEVDGIGNVFATIEFVPGAPAVLTGSHLDSQPRGGRFDGAYGVIASLHAAVEIQRRVEGGELRPKYNLVVVDWFNEEGSRFAPSIMGSSVYTGLMDRDEILAVRDLAGTSVRDALDGIGYLGSAQGPRDLAGYAEVHIEQGRILEREGIAIGAVDSSWYTQKLDIDIIGEQSHTGATAMADRRDALVGAAKVTLLVRDICDEYPAESLVSSVGQITVEPNSPIVVNSHVHLVADLRANDPAIVQGARDALVERFRRVAEEERLEIVAKDFDIRPNRYYPREGVELQERVAERLGLGVRRIQTMAGHDSVALNTVAPSVMMFVPSVDGVSHCEREFTRDEDMVNGLAALSGVISEMLTGALDGVSYPGEAADYAGGER
ncbi:M20 family metallo-hydrolase [Leucobacter ruminantium]|uniref:M20 family metallo-hydrolase n=1 Tax=Leucobacter ruminantium TaxID=1289170 RepID=A0A939RWY4_9MICO|nr:M20 family metallo-hydrolase [Leucobacter ruminantium]MBO1804143.1 M20 family metallo-hydrolase [Leucobacter ruminantium]